MRHFFWLGIAFERDSTTRVNLFLFIGNRLRHAGFDWPRTDAVNGNTLSTEFDSQRSS